MTAIPVMAVRPPAAALQRLLMHHPRLHPDSTAAAEFRKLGLHGMPFLDEAGGDRPWGRLLEMQPELQADSPATARVAEPASPTGPALTAALRGRDDEVQAALRGEEDHLEADLHDRSPSLAAVETPLAPRDEMPWARHGGGRDAHRDDSPAAHETAVGLDPPMSHRSAASDSLAAVEAQEAALLADLGGLNARLAGNISSLPPVAGQREAREPHPEAHSAALPSPHRSGAPLPPPHGARASPPQPGAGGRYGRPPPRPPHAGRPSPRPP
eukprot:TRINITY_DN25095_c0_g1_i1.p1 TRINITY_DN25095_c0_g1~~TRINITY_DN25095_c0_g1_i1.p1  ORF type:complete len:270 (+),score=47.52 TRINITY_DN25095_c0_g1_i1:73-882(+)